MIRNKRQTNKPIVTNRNQEMRNPVPLIETKNPMQQTKTKKSHKTSKSQ
jgi:hypothetical protein